VRILHLLKTTGIAGAETHLLALASGLRLRGLEVSLLILEDPSRPASTLRKEAEKLGLQTQTIPIYAHLDPTLLPRLAPILRRSPFDILHAHLPHAEVYGALALRGIPASRFVITRHSDNPFRRNPFWQLVFAPSWRRANKIIAISEAVGRAMIQSEHIPSDRIAVIPYGLNGEEFASRAIRGGLRRELGVSEGPLVGFVGRLARPKGPDLLLRAFAEIQPQETGAHLVMAGDGPWRQPLLRLRRDLGLKNVHFLGWREDVASVLADLDVVVMPSRWEGFGLVALQAMALEKPVIATRVSALPEVVADAVSGVLVPPEDPSSLSREIVRLLRDPALASRLGHAGTLRARQEFSLEQMMSKTQGVYRQVLEGESSADRGPTPRV
jgi:glycosyltransferase involved in cell wall biosynthesis